MNEHVKEDKELAKPVLDLVEQPVGNDVVYFQDNDYPVDPLDLPDHLPAPGKGATEEREGVERHVD